MFSSIATLYICNTCKWALWLSQISKLPLADNFILWNVKLAVRLVVDLAWLVMLLCVTVVISNTQPCPKQAHEAVN